ncbi:hypothetical protein PWT90_03165 [Aphanocladium album]|nr:hypothetical protein PWT90_03165 [Aphanocladium album]
MAAPLVTCLWFDKEAEEAAQHYVSIFAPNSAITYTKHYTAAGQDTHKQPPGAVLLVEFTLRGQKFVALNGGKQAWSFNPGVSFQIDCEDQAEVDHFWDKLGAGGDESAQKCSWLSDRYGVSWQVVPKVMKTFLASDDKEASDRAMVAMMGMKKLDIAALQKAFDNA